MRALLVDRSAPRGLRLGETEPPSPLPHEALVRVRSASLNLGEIALAAGHVADDLARPRDGTVLGADVAGIVERGASDGSGPPAGTPVVSVGDAGGWAELRAVPTTAVGVVPRGADLGAAAALPVAGLTALRALHRVGPVLGRTILVTGAGGGVGRFAVQLAHRGGARVVALTSDPVAHGDILRRLGAVDVVAEPDGVYDGVVDLVGGRLLVRAFRALRPHGQLVAVGHSSAAGETFAFGDLFGNGGRHDRSLATFYLGDTAPFDRDLTWLAEQTVAGRVDPQISWCGSWEDVDDAVDALLERRLHGKAVIDLT